MSRLYLSGPMRGIPHFNFEAFDSAAAWLRRQGYDVVSPADHDRDVDPGIEQTAAYETGEGSGNRDPKFQALIGWDLAQITEPGNVDGIALLPGWEQSSGVAMELQAARWTGKRVFYLIETRARTSGGPWKHCGWAIYEEQPSLVVGLMGYAQAGKDTVGAFLVEHHGFVRVSFADALRDMLYALNPIAYAGSMGDWETVQEIVDSIGWDRAKVSYPEIRALLQRLGTEAGREILGQSIWVDTAIREVQPGGRYVFTDVRFPNEAATIRAMGGKLWRVKRPGTAPVNAHPSETALDDLEADTTISNNGPLPQLRSLIFSLAGSLLASVDQ